jgi:ATP-dependent DNA helicase RecG
MGRPEELGTGVKNVFKYSKAYSGSDKIVFEENDVFIAKVPLKESFQDTDNSTERPNEQINEGLNEGLTTLLNAIIKNPGIQARNLSTLLNNRPIKTIERQISELTQRKFIERRGSKKTGGYFSIHLKL